jgi:hypothetical protein
VSGQLGHHAVDHLRVHEGAVAGDPHDNVGVRLARREHEAREHVPLAAADAADALRVRQRCERVVASLDACREHDVGQARRAAQPPQRMRGERDAADLHERLAGQAHGAHAGLHDSDHAHRPGRLQPTFYDHPAR